MISKIKAYDNYDTVDQGGTHESDQVELLKIIRDVMSNFQSQRLQELSIITAMQRLFSLHQYT